MQQVFQRLPAGRRSLYPTWIFRYFTASGAALCTSALILKKALPRRGFDDLMASEARLTSYTAIAKGDVPRRHWRRLSRAMRSSAATAAWQAGRARCLSTSCLSFFCR